MGAIVLVIALLLVGLGLWAYRLYLQHDFEVDGTDIGDASRPSMTTDGLPSDAAIRSGELGRGAGSNAFRNL